MNLALSHGAAGPSGPSCPAPALLMAVRRERMKPVAPSWLGGHDWGTSCHMWPSAGTGEQWGPRGFL